MQNLTTDQRLAITDMLCELRRLSDSVFDTQDLTDMALVWMANRGYVTDDEADYDRIYEAVNTVRNNKPYRCIASEAVEDWIHYESPQHREEICAPNTEY